MADRTTKLETFRGRNHRWFYRFRAGNGEVVVQCAKPDGYSRRWTADRAGRRLLRSLRGRVEIVAL